MIYLKKFMKSYLMIVSLVVCLCSCGGASDGNPNTDTTTMPVDTNLNSDTSNHVNTSAGTKVADSTGRDTMYKQ